MISLQHITKSFPGRPPVDVLHDCTSSIAAGELVSIMGPSGSGKSTLLNILGLLDVPTSGQYLFEGDDISQMTEHDRTRLRAQSLGFVFQSFYLLPHYTAAENVALGRMYGTKDGRRNRLRAAEEALRVVNMQHRLDSLPKTLSGGESQRVAIARALVNMPRVIFCDEPTGNLDSVSTESILVLLSSLAAEGITIVIVTHDDKVAMAAQRSLRIYDGVLTEDPQRQGTRR